jgi:long-chain fatty acid transport protein
MRTNRILSAALVACGAIGLSTSAHATNGYQLIGVGAYQKGMGGAVTANPGSAMTAITNPAGMAAIGDRADFSMEAFMPDRETDFTNNPGGEKVTSDAEMYGIPAIGWTAPVSDGSDLYFGGGMYGTSGLGVDYPVANFSQHPVYTNVDFDGYSSIAFWQMAPTLAWKVNDQLKVGAALNIDYQSVGFQQRLTSDNTGPANVKADGTLMNFNLGRTANAFGFGVTLGALYEINDMVTVGASYKSPQEFSDLEYNLRRDDIYGFPNGSGGTVASNQGTYKLGLDYPQQLAAGVKITPMDRLKISADVKWINWSSTMDDLAIKGDFRIVNGSGPTEAAMDPGWDDQIVYSVGVDYMVTNDLNLRAGYNYAEAPIEKNDVFSNLLLPAMTEQHLTFGATYQFNNHWEASFAYMKAFENDVTGKNDVPQSFSAAPASGGFGSSSNAKISLEEDSYSVNIGYRF